MESGVFPDNLKIAAICQIYKREGSKSSPNNYRPISVLPIVARSFENIIHNQLYDYINPIQARLFLPFEGPYDFKNQCS